MALDDIYSERDSVAWYWRALSLAASWMILGGYCILPSTFDTDSRLRFSNTALTIIVVILLTAGHSLTPFLYFACRSPIVRAEALLLPCTSSSGLGLLATVYAFASSSRYSFSGAGAPVAVVLSITSTIIYATLLYFTQRRITKQRDYALDKSRSPLHRTTSSRQTDDTYRSTVSTPSFPNGGSTSPPRSTPSHHARPTTEYYQNYYANQWPSALHSPANSAVFPPGDDPDENDPTKRNLALLLTRASSDHPGTGSTFKIEWPGGEEDEVQIERIEQVSRKGPDGTTQVYSRLLAVPGSVRRQFGRERADSGGRRGERIGRGDAADGAGKAVNRAKSREERRREIELGDLAGSSNPGP